jgi:hypothetical protein
VGPACQPHCLNSGAPTVHPAMPTSPETLPPYGTATRPFRRPPQPNHRPSAVIPHRSSCAAVERPLPVSEPHRIALEHLPDPSPRANRRESGGTATPRRVFLPSPVWALGSKRQNGPGHILAGWAKSLCRPKQQ